MIYIRSYTQEDTSAIVELFTQAVHTINKKHYSKKQREAWAPLQADHGAWHQRLAGMITIVAEKDSDIVGFASMTDRGHLDHLYVSIHHQGGSISLPLLRHIESIARDTGITVLTTDCSITAKKPAERMGFEVVVKQTVSKNGIDFINYKMQKTL